MAFLKSNVFHCDAIFFIIAIDGNNCNHSVVVIYFLNFVLSLLIVGPAHCTNKHSLFIFSQSNLYLAKNDTISELFAEAMIGAHGMVVVQSRVKVFHWKMIAFLSPTGNLDSLMSRSNPLPMEYQPRATCHDSLA